jgi:hypothetical protein
MMLAQVMQFNGPRSAELLAAADRASKERLGPIMMAHPRVREEFVGLLTLRQPTGEQLTVLIMQTAEGLDLVRELIMSSELLPGEDPALLPGPDRVDVYDVTEMTGSLAAVSNAEAASR